MKENITIALKLTLICFVAVLLLSLVNLLTAGTIEKNASAEVAKANKELFPEGEEFVKTNFKPGTEKIGDNDFYYIVKNNQGGVIGYIASITGSGFGGEIGLLIAFSKNLKIINMKLLKNSETPGFGKKWEHQKSMDMFVGTNTKEKPFPTKKSMVAPEFQDGPNGVTGATITFNGITEATARAIRLMNNL